MKFISKNIIHEIEEIVSKNNFLLIEIVERGNPNNPVFEFYIDGAESVSTEDCAKVSREIGTLIDAEDSVSKKYRLDVSSPGTDRPLKYIEQYPKNIGRKFDVKFRINEDVKKIKAELTGVSESRLNFKTDQGEEYLIDIIDVIKAKVLITF